MDLQSMLTGDWFGRLATATSATTATPATTPTPDVASVAPVAVATQPVKETASAAQASHAPPQNDDDGIFPASWHQQFNARVQCCLAHGIPQNEAESLAIYMMPGIAGERERKLCLECVHLYGSPSARRCRQWRKIGLTSGPAIPQDLVTMLQRCPGFTSRFEIHHDKEASPHEHQS